MKSNLIKVLSRASSALSRSSMDIKMIKPHYFPSKQIVPAKKFIQEAAIKTLVLSSN